MQNHWLRELQHRAISGQIPYQAVQGRGSLVKYNPARKVRSTPFAPTLFFHLKGLLSSQHGASIPGSATAVPSSIVNLRRTPEATAEAARLLKSEPAFRVPFAREIFPMRNRGNEKQSCGGVSGSWCARLELQFRGSDIHWFPRTSTRYYRKARSVLLSTFEKMPQGL